ncbi:L-ascorbate-specific enzyme IIA component of PTS [Erysipelotrichaceae bacterium]|nr:L-ascorbate-specific enzyme IIA component of PTS [Erysipelotrichaceae bacterium]
MSDLRQSLAAEKSILLQQKANTWEEAIALCVAPLEQSGAVSDAYAKAIIASTLAHGPYYILTPGMAMPHARPEDGVMRNAFSLITLVEPVIFPDGKPVSILVCLAATSAEIHLSKAIPQIIALFELDDIFNKLAQAEDESAIYDLLEQTKGSKYLANFTD